MNIKTSNLSGEALDWAVATAVPCAGLTMGLAWSPSTTWVQCGALIQKYGVWLSDDADEENQGPWIASVNGGGMSYGETPLIAACRAIVSAKLSDIVDIPKSLIGQGQ